VGYCVVQTGTRTHLLTRSLNLLVWVAGWLGGWLAGWRRGSLLAGLLACRSTLRVRAHVPSDNFLNAPHCTALHYVQDEKDNFPKFNPLKTKRIMETQQQQFDVDSFGAF
jgi:hypothetical protein